MIWWFAKRMLKVKNPYQLVWFRADWSETRTAKNNTLFWNWEIRFNGLQPDPFGSIFIRHQWST